MTRIIIIILSIILIQPVKAQQALLDGNAAFESGDYRSAIAYYDLYKNINIEADALERRGKAHFHINNLQKAIYDLTKARKLGNENPELYYLMAEVKQHLGDYEEAIFFYEQYIHLNNEPNPKKDKANREIKNCIYNALNKKDEGVALVQEFGEEINTQYDEIHPLQSPVIGNAYYFSSNRNRREFEIISCTLEKNGVWNKEAKSITANTPNHDFPLDISPTGSSMLVLSKGNQIGTGRIIFSAYDSLGQETQIPVPASVLSDEEDIQIVNRNTLVFSSDQLEGYGGYDVYTITYNDGVWSNPRNLGPEINSAYDERYPHMTSDREQLFFSSNRPYSYGGFDIYYCESVSDDKEINNVGFPINSAGDDIQFRLDDAGHKAIFSSDRKIGHGGFDLYFGYMMRNYNLPASDSIDFLYVTDELLKRNQNKQLQETPDTLESDAEELEPEKEIITIDELPEKKVADPIIEEEPIEIKTPRSNIPKPESYNLYYEDRFDVRNPKNLNIIENIAEELLRDKYLNVRMIVHTDHREPGLPEFQQYNTLQRGKIVADELKGYGINPKRIALESVVFNFPAAKAEVSGNENKEHLEANKRIDFQLVRPNGQIVHDYTFDETTLPVYARDRKYILYSDIKEELYYSVQIAQSERIFKHAALRVYDDIYIRKETADGPNDYYIGIYTSYSDAMDLRTELEKTSLPLHKIVAFYNGRKVDATEIKALSAMYPDIEEYKNGLE